MESAGEVAGHGTAPDGATPDTVHVGYDRRVDTPSAAE
jgi:hypothetical protein